MNFITLCIITTISCHQHYVEEHVLVVCCRGQRSSLPTQNAMSKYVNYARHLTRNREKRNPRCSGRSNHSKNYQTLLCFRQDNQNEGFLSAKQMTTTTTTTNLQSSLITQKSFELKT
ncbi:hypothetical protein VNO77_00315 [Canavalia gladiata]|uniref:Uncharacterized protein n=1 Tax=Canavalia gladiata TaxID=3824 RepID=A0AAN9MVM3_CANGL